MDRLIILGCGSALPTSVRNPTAQVLDNFGRYFLIDCGEGTQSRLRENKISFEKITHIFISHLHGDHFLGLPGLLSTMQLLGRKRGLKLFGPKDLWELLQFQFKVSKTYFNFDLTFEAVEEERVLFTDKSLKVRSIKLNHRIESFGFVFEELPKQRRINGLAAKEAGVPHFFMSNLREGEDYVDDSGKIYSNQELTLDPKKSNSYAFCGDNRIKKDFHEKLVGVNHVYHEATFLHKELDRAKKTYHSTVQEACELGAQLKLDQLILGHYSARYIDLEEIKEEAIPLFDNVEFAEDGKVFHFNS